MSWCDILGYRNYTDFYHWDCPKNLPSWDEREINAHTPFLR
jgi:hypothetical protein